ncbi:hypothetical protein K3172_01585 [Qipengyuania sp. 6B39]|uniref:hypothetical protein n=1 Tax=Qipengyuania proteolytica TaxID=2867239 RepID=UPI001C8AB6ED|nr:hypothetical protein [Qipengyuania proteolytica]MBX7494542.1 hypothetical protein [Qipengyuania proteolytica]
MRCDLNYPAVAIALVAASLPYAARAEGELPPPIENPAVDEFGVELKSGRYGGLSIPLVSIGGAAPYALTWTYAPQDGRYLFTQSTFNVDTRQVNFSTGDLPDFYDVKVFRYPGGASKFRRKSGTTVWQPEYATGDTFDGSTFTDKYGVKIIEGPGMKLIYPDGREVWAGSTSGTFDPVAPNMREMRNNFGFWLRGLRAVNMARDYCSPDLNQACSGFTENRTASVTSPGWDAASPPASVSMSLTNSDGEVTQVKFISAWAYDRDPCRVISNGWGGQSWGCSGTGTAYYYPTEIRYPGSTAADVTIIYGRHGQPSINGVDRTTHNDILIDNLYADGVPVTYNSRIYPYSINQYATMGFQVLIDSSINGNRHKSSQAYQAGAIWPTGRLILEGVQDALSRGKRYGYNAKGDVASVTFPEGNGVTYTFDGRFNVISAQVRSKVSGQYLTTTYEYPPSCTTATQAYCNLPTAVIDPSGNRTEYTYNARGQVLTKTEPAPAPGAARPVTRHQYTMRTAMVLNSTGGYVPAGSAVSMLTRTSTCRTVENCQGTSDEVVTQYDYGPTAGPNNLLLRGVAVTAVNSSGQLETQRTCYGYNYFGEKISETQPKAGLTSCP